MLFKKHHIDKILHGQKTMTRRLSKRQYHVGSKQGIRSQWFQKSIAHILITRRFKQRLGDINLEDVKKEGYSSLEEFRKVWTEINGSWDPNIVVTVYEFQVVK